MEKKQLKRILKAIAGETRLEILAYLKQHQTASVGEIANALQRADNTISLHLQRLERLNIVVRRQRGVQAFYRLSLHQEPLVRQVLSLLYNGPHEPRMREP
jgi:DNA-binding transcriptional ArsR family regulator